MSEKQLTNKNIVQQIGVKYYLHNTVARRMYDIKVKNMYTNESPRYS